VSEIADPARSRLPGRRWSPRRLPLFLKVALVVWTLWAVLIVALDKAGSLIDYSIMTVTMVFGSFIAGATSEGGGAVAFPVMTLLLGISPAVARDFSHLIQSVGMTAASLTILLGGIAVHRPTLLYAGFSGAVGVVLSLSFVAHLIPPVPAKLMFTSVWLSFGACLAFIVFVARTRPVETFACTGWRPILVLLVAGLVGGLISGIFGTGLDILVFSVIVLVFGLHERVATPTSVILMAGNSLVAVAWRELLPFTEPMAAQAWAYWYACVPVVAIGAPLGALFIARRSRTFIAGLLMVSILVQYGLSLVVLPIDAALMGLSLATFAAGLLFFAAASRIGRTDRASRQGGIGEGAPEGRTIS